MRICHYPGRAIDATLSLDQKSPMENIYKNNWLNADKTIKTIGRNSNIARHIATNGITKRSNQNGKSLENVYSSESADSGAHQSSSSSDDERRRNSHSSSLSRYQVTLEQMQKLDLEQPNELFQKTMRSLNGYKPSTIRQKDRRCYNDWDNENESDLAVNRLKSHRNSEHFTIDWPQQQQQKQLARVESASMPKINRSQTVRFPSSSDLKNINSLNIRNMFHQNGEHKSSEMLPTATISKHFNRTKRANNRANHFDDFDTLANGNGLPPIDYGRTMPHFKQISNTRVNGCTESATSSPHNKSVRINPMPIGKQANGNGVAGHSDNERKEPNGKNREQRKLPRLISIMKKKSNAMRKKSAEPMKPAPILNQWIESQKLHKPANGNGTTNGDTQPVDRHRNGAASSDSKNSSTSSLSSASSNCNKSGSSNVSDFSIPRPRLIVPVHTYARRRRTGNLVQNCNEVECDVNESDLSPFDRYQSVSGANNNNNGKNTWMKTPQNIQVAQIRLLFMCLVRFVIDDGSLNYRHNKTVD